MTNNEHGWLPYKWPKRKAEKFYNKNTGTLCCIKISGKCTFKVERSFPEHFVTAAAVHFGEKISVFTFTYMY